MILFTVGIPFYLFYDLWKHREHLHDTSSVKYHQIRFKMGSFFKAYEEDYWYFEVVVIFQKMLMAGALAVIAPRNPAQLLIGFFVGTVYVLVATCVMLFVMWTGLLELDKLTPSHGRESQCSRF